MVVTWDDSEWKILSTPDIPHVEKSYATKDGIGVIVKDILNDDPSFPFRKAIDDIDEARAFHRQDFESEKGGIVECEPFEKDQVKGYYVIGKTKDPKSSGLIYTGMLVIEYEPNHFKSINLAAKEIGMSGGRESSVMFILSQKGEVNKDLDGWASDPYDDTYKPEGILLRNRADDAEYDESLPNHPLSKIRRTLDSVKSSLKVE